MVITYPNISKTMKTTKLNVFIVDDNLLMCRVLKQYLQNKFNINITIFESGESCLERIDSQTHLVILDYFLNGRNGLDILKLIKAINPKIEVIMLSNNSEPKVTSMLLKAGAKDYVLKGKESWKKITEVVSILIKNTNTNSIWKRIINILKQFFKWNRKSKD